MFEGGRRRGGGDAVTTRIRATVWGRFACPYAHHCYEAEGNESQHVLCLRRSNVTPGSHEPLNHSKGAGRPRLRNWRRWSGVTAGGEVSHEDTRRFYPLRPATPSLEL